MLERFSAKVSQTSTMYLGSLSVVLILNKSRYLYLKATSIGEREGTHTHTHTYIHTQRERETETETETETKTETESVSEKLGIHGMASVIFGISINSTEVVLDSTLGQRQRETERDRKRQRETEIERCSAIGHSMWPWPLSYGISLVTV